MSIIQEYEFWNSVFLHHLEFILNSLSAQKVLEDGVEKQFYERAKELKTYFSDLQADDRNKSIDYIIELAYQLKELKHGILDYHLKGRIAISLPPTFINHMINEVDESISLFTYYRDNDQLPPINKISQHKLWLLDAAGHADAIISQLDPTEGDLRKKLKSLKVKFTDLYLKATEYAGYLRATLDTEQLFPAANSLDLKAGLEITIFLGMLKELHANRLNNETLGTIMPLMLEHMILEENYYLSKIL